jgi:deoxyribonuclease-2
MTSKYGVGVLAHRHGKGFYIIHTQPKYPKPGTGYGGVGAKHSKINGQMFICVSLADVSIQAVAEHIKHIKAIVYAKNENEPAWDAGVNTVCDTQTPTKLESTGAQVFFLFCKPPNDQVDIWSSHVGSFVGGPLLVQSWRLGGGRPLKSVCPEGSEHSAEGTGQIVIEDITKLRYKTDVIHAQFNSTKDHGKWAVNKNVPYLCIGDLNRMESQNKRGGGVLCMWNDNVAKAFRSMVHKTDCDKDQSW